jgi:hypothetical protein
MQSKTSEDLALELVRAVRRQDLDLVQSLIKKNANPNFLVPMAWFEDWKEPEVDPEVTSNYVVVSPS